VFLRPTLEKTPYEVYKGKKPIVSYFHVFGCKCFILKNANNRTEKFEEKSDKGIFLGYSTSSKAYRVYNKKTQSVEESMNVKFQDLVENQEDHTHLEESEPASDFTKSTSPEVTQIAEDQHQAESEDPTEVEDQ